MNWKHLLPLLLPFLVLSPSISWAQTPCETSELKQITAPSGLRMRSAPKISGKVVTTVPFDSLVMACKEKYGELKVDDQMGHWTFVVYKEFEGFMFDGYMKTKATEPVAISPPPPPISVDSLAVSKPIEEPIRLIHYPTQFKILTEAYNYCGDANTINPGINWYAFYMSEQDQADMAIEKVKIQVILSEQKLSESLEFDIRTTNSNKSVFLLGSENSLDIDKIKRASLRGPDNPISLFPGQKERFAVNASTESVELSALGNVISLGDCPEIDGYQLLGKSIIKGENRTQNIAPLLNLAGSCGLPKAIWVGDINGDEIVDILWAARSMELSVFTLLISDINGSSIWKVSDTWTLSPCK